ncbi:MAG: hypothetical protein B6244_06760 [Candidatus Cloacimonetes bacterium 4572_55]|nr:MAG: hypothetical protein B6244_06760 [Candidatus Cloacimonetes bacterium 4572_55]
MLQKYLNFLRGISVNLFGKLGVILTTSSFIIFVILELARLLGILTNQYMGLLTYLLFPNLFVVGLALIFIGWLILKKQTGKSTEELLSSRFKNEDIAARKYGSNVFITVLILTFISLIFMGLATARMLKFMETAQFCGTACHKVMNPEWVVYQNSPHARVTCVQCHVGEGTDALISSKLNGARQMALATFNIYNRPVPTPVHTLRPARETCEKCHWPDKFYGDRLKTIVRYADDEASTPKYTSLGLKIDMGCENEKTGIHWHIAKENEVRYTSVGDQRDEMIWVESIQPDGSFKRFRNKRLTSSSEIESNDIRTLDCVDCHNRATHIYENPEDAVDDRIRMNLISRDLPFIKREGLSALTNNYPNREAAAEGIRNHIEGFYQRHYPNVGRQNMAKLDQAVLTLTDVYNRNIHHNMEIDWGVYPSHIGHKSQMTGCFRCHNQNMVTDDNSSIRHECTMCHSILAQESEKPFQYLQPAISERDSLLHESLRLEFMSWR